VAETYRVHISKEDLVFSSAHFITYAGDQCERLHGHNYRVGIAVSGPLDENHYVVDFLLLHRLAKAIVDALDHRVLLPTQHQSIEVVVDGNEVQATFQDRRWIFPRDDCVLLPVGNTTSELLARHIARRLLDDLLKEADLRPAHLEVEVDDCFGQTARVSLID
jgi:6-pyruvoyltetrahydropterin/6-carboxytetrahydropterin synthase